MNWRRTTFEIAAFLAIAALGAAVALHSLIDPERLKRLVQQKAHAAGLHNLAIGDVSLALWPLPSLEALEISLPGVMRVERFNARLALLPLATGTVRYKSLALAGATLDIDASRDTPLPQADVLRELESLELEGVTIRYKSRSGAASTWRIDNASIEMEPGWHDVRIEAAVTRNGRPLKVTAELADLSRLGSAGVTTTGRIDADWGEARLAIEGRIPLTGAIAGHALRAELKSASLDGMLQFFGIKSRRTAPAQARFEVSEAEGTVSVTKLQASLGALRFGGEGRITFAGPKPVIDARVSTENLDWVRAQLDAGADPVPPLAPDEMFYDIPLGWDLLVAMQGARGRVDAAVGRLLLRNGLELRNLKASIAFDDDRLNASPFSAQMLGGTATANVQLEGRKKSARVKFEGANLLLERWFRERGSKIAFRGGPMKVSATLAATGASMKDLAASMTGPVSIRMGPGVLESEKAGHAEAVMMGLQAGLAGKEATQIDFECVGARLPFSAGRAAAQPIIGVRSRASSLLTSGVVDFRTQSVELRGRLRARSGMNLGFGAIAGDILVSGKIRQPHTSLDPERTPGAVVRGVAAVATLGMSVVGTGLVDAARGKRDDPCEAVFK